MSEILFYHLERQPVEQVLPLLLEKTLQRGWRAVVQASRAETLDSLSDALWVWRDDAFLPHGVSHKDDARLAPHQPIWLCADETTPNEAQIRFCLEGTTASHPDRYERVIYLFDGHDEDSVQKARDQWKAMEESGCERTYWQQNEHGQWEKKA